MRSTSDLIRAAIRIEIARQDSTQTRLAQSIQKSSAWISTRMGGSVPITIEDLDLIAKGLGLADAGDLVKAALNERASSQEVA